MNGQIRCVGRAELLEVTSGFDAGLIWHVLFRADADDTERGDAPFIELQCTPQRRQFEFVWLRPKVLVESDSLVDVRWRIDGGPPTQPAKWRVIYTRSGVQAPEREWPSWERILRTAKVIDFQVLIPGPVDGFPGESVEHRFRLDGAQIALAAVKPCQRGLKSRPIQRRRPL